MKLFSLDSSFHKYGTILFDTMALSIFWLLTVFFSFGLLTPLATAALFNSINHTLIEEDGYLTRSYFTVYKNKFLKSLGLTLFGLIMYGLSTFNIYAISVGAINLPFLLPLYLFIFVEVTLILVFACALMTETDMSLKQLLKYGFILSNKHFFVSLAFVAGVIALLLLLFIFNNFLIIIIGIVPLFWLMTWLIQKKVFINYHLDKLL